MFVDPFILAVSSAKASQNALCVTKLSLLFHQIKLIFNKTINTKWECKKINVRWLACKVYMDRFKLQIRTNKTTQLQYGFLETHLKSLYYVYNLKNYGH